MPTPTADVPAHARPLDAGVRVVTIHGEQFIRTDSNSVKADNLGSLPEYS